ncbi:MAG: hypothetical protein L0212_11650 [Acidobacteria bacterium]|nr:hypothetical protein [Acidobacteriota bacterium]
MLVPVAAAAETKVKLTAEEVVNRMVTAHGGLERWRAISTLSYHHTLFIPNLTNDPGKDFWWISHEAIDL